MQINIYGLGCDNYFKLLEMVNRAIYELKLKADVNEIYQPEHFIRDGIGFMPSLSINGKVVITGSVPSMENLKALLFKYGKASM